MAGTPNSGVQEGLQLVNFSSNTNKGEDLHPTLKKRLEIHLQKRGKNGNGLNLENPSVIDFAWKELDIAHAEFRALDDILKKIDRKGVLGEAAIKRITGYNSFLKSPGIQGTCADCFYLTHGVTFIKL